MVLQVLDTERYGTPVTAFLIRICKNLSYFSSFCDACFSCSFFPSLCPAATLGSFRMSSLWVLQIELWTSLFSLWILLFAANFSFLLYAAVKKKIKNPSLVVSTLGQSTPTYPKMNCVSSSPGQSMPLPCVCSYPQHMERSPGKAWPTMPK